MEFNKRPSFVLISANPGKVLEFQQLWDPFVIKPVPDELLDRLKAIQETGQSYEENAVIKVSAFRDRIPMDLLADDSGLEVTCLGGRPGVKSARYGSPLLSAEERSALLLSEVQRMSQGAGRVWEAKFVCSLAWLSWNEAKKRHEDVPLVVTASCEGQIGEPRGNQGFGYDPIFYPKEIAGAGSTRGRSMAELAPIEKNLISHRAKAVRLLINALKLV